MVKKFTDYGAFTDLADDDILLGVDVSDTTQSAQGSSKTITVEQLSNNAHNSLLFTSDMFGLDASSTAAQWQSAIDDVVAAQSKTLYIKIPSVSLDAAVDCKGVRMVCDQTEIPCSLKTFVNHGGIDNGLIAGVNTSAMQINTTLSPTFDAIKFIRRNSGSAENYSVFLAKKNPKEGYLEVLFRENYVTTTNSLGGNSATRVNMVYNVNDIAFYKHAYDSASHVPVDTLTRKLGTGAGTKRDVGFWNVPAGEYIEFSAGDYVSEEISILFLLSAGSSTDVDITVGGVLIDNVSLVRASGVPEILFYRKPVNTLLAGTIRITNNDPSKTAYLAGVNAYRPAERVPPWVVVDEHAYSRNSNDFAQDGGASDYALRRHPDSYTGSKPTGGSYHGGETPTSQAVYLDGALASMSGADITFASRVQVVTSAKIIWDDAVEVTALRAITIADGGILKEIRLDCGSVEFDSVWTTMWNTPTTFTTVRGAAARDISGVSSEFVCYDRCNVIQQSRGFAFGLHNQFTVYDNERNSNGGPYVASEAGTRKKLYYGPVLFNKGVVGTIHSQQYTEFYGVN